MARRLQVSDSAVNWRKTGANGQQTCLQLHLQHPGMFGLFLVSRSPISNQSAAASHLAYAPCTCRPAIGQDARTRESIRRFVCCSFATSRHETGSVEVVFRLTTATAMAALNHRARAVSW